MNAVEIEEAVSQLAAAPFDAAEFPCAFLEAFGNKPTTLKRLRTGNTNQSDVGGLLQRGNIHLKVAALGEVAQALTALRTSPATARQKAKFILATDGRELLAEQLIGDVPPLACAFADLPNHFAFFLPLAGITTVRQIAENAFDIRATGRLNRLYVELLKTNPDWDTAARREELNHFFARLIFCFFAEDTGIFDGLRLFTDTLEKMTERDGSNTHAVLARLFEAMNTAREKRAESDLPGSALQFPYVNGNLFSGSVDCPRFSKIARSYLLFVGGLDWKLINPDIFGSMIQAVADDEERGALGMHYTSVPNILKVLNPLFLDDLRAKLDEAGDGSDQGSKRKLLNLRNRLARIRVFDPACGSGNFLVIAYIEMRKIEAAINQRRGGNERELPSVIPSTNFRGIEIRSFAAEIARLALIIAKFQCDALHIGDLFARRQVLPLGKDNWITCGNALRLDWLQICPPTGTGVKVVGDDLFNTPKDQVEIDFENAGGETYICGNPPYKGARKQNAEEKADLREVFSSHEDFKDADYVIGWFIKAATFVQSTLAKFALVATSSISQGEQVQFVWPRIWGRNQEIFFAYAPFKWSNNAAHNAGVYVTVVGVRGRESAPKTLFDEDQRRSVPNISPYLTAGDDVVVKTTSEPISASLGKMVMGNMARDDGNLIIGYDDAEKLGAAYPEAKQFLAPLLGTKEIVNGTQRLALHLTEANRAEWSTIPFIRDRVQAVRVFRETSPAKTTNGYASIPYRFAQYCHRHQVALALPSVTTERSYVTPTLLPPGVLVTNLAYLVYDFGFEAIALLASRMHLVWASAVSGRLGSGLRYTPTVSYHTFPVPPLSDQNKADLTRCAEEILLTREAHFPATIADLYDPDDMDTKYPDLRAAHDRNDETLERIYIGRKFKNDTERLEKLFELYTQMAAKAGKAETKPAKRRKTT